MMIKDIASQLKEETQTGSLSFEQLAVLAPPVATLLAYYPEAQTLTLSGVEIIFNASDKTIRLKGSSPWSTGLPLHFEILLSEVNGHLIASAEVGLPSDHELAIPGLSWFTLSEAGVSLATLEPSLENELLHRYYKGGLHCTMQLGSTKIPLSGEYSGASELVLAADLKGIQMPSLADLAQVVGGRNTISIPEQIDALGNVQLKELEVTTATTSTGVSKLANISFSFGTKEAWNIVPNVFTVKELLVEVNVAHPLDQNRWFFGYIQGGIKIGAVDALLTAEKGLAGEWEFTAEIPLIDLASIASQALTGLPLPAKLPEISFENTTLTVVPATGDYRFSSQSSEKNNWKISIGDSKGLVIKDLKLNASKTNHQFSGYIEGTTVLFGTEMIVSTQLDEELTLRATLLSANLSSIAEQLLKAGQLPVDLPNFVFENLDLAINTSTGEFMLSGISTTDWEIPLGVTGLLIDTVTLSMERKKGANNKKEITGIIGGEVSIAGVEFDLSFSFPGDYKLEARVASISLGAIIQDLCGTAALQGFPAPSSVLNLSLENVKISVAPTAGAFSILGNSSMGETEVIVSKDKKGKWGFAVAIAPADDWRFSSIDANLSVLDSLSLSNIGLVLSSADTKGLPLNIISIPKRKQINKGLIFISDLDLSNLGVDDLINLESLNVSAAIGTKPSSIVLEAAIDGSLQLAENFAMGNMRFRLRPAPSNFSLGIAGSVIAKLDDSELEFVGTMNIAPIERSASFAATMLGEWQEPFGTKGFSIADLAIEIGLGIVPPPAVAAPIIGLAGTVSIGTFTGSAAVKMDTVVPTKSMVSAAFNHLYLKEVVQQFCDKKVYNNIPADIRNTILAVGFEDVAVHIVPTPTQIGELIYEEGFRFQGKMNIAEFNAEFLFELDYAKGIRIFAQMDEINVENIFIISGSGNQLKPSIDVNLMMGETPGIQIAGSIFLLGVSAQTYININDSGFEFLMEGKIFDAFNASIQASGGNLKGGGDFYLKVHMRNDLISYLREEALEAIQNAAEVATNEINAAQRDLDYAKGKVASIQKDIDMTRATIVKERARDTKAVRNAEQEVSNAQNAVKTLDTNIANMRRTINAERARNTQKVKNAERAVINLQNKVNGLNTNIANMRAAIKRERANDTRKLVAARNNVTAAQNKVDALQKDINSSYARIKSLKKSISKKKKWYNNSPWYKKSYRWAEYSAYAAAKGAEITALYTKIGGIESAKATAKAALEVAKQVVKGIEKGIKTFPIDSDPRILALFTAKGSANASLTAANASLKAARAVITTIPVDADPRIAALFTSRTAALGTLEVAKQTLKAAKALIKTFPIDADPRIMALFTAKESANASLIVANEFLEGVKSSIGGMATVSTFIVEKGIGGLLDIKEAMFEGQLNVVKGGSVAMALSVELMSKPHDLSLAFNFHNPISGAKALGEKLLKILD